MGKRIGNTFVIVFTLLFMSALYPKASVRLDILHSDGRSLKQAGVGVPFLMQITIENGGKNIESIEVAGINKFNIESRGSSTQMTTVNGVSSVKKKYNYLLRIDKEGSYTIGPAKIKIDEKKVQTNAVKLKVVEKVSQKNNSKYAWLDMIATKQNIFLGENVTIGIRFFYIPNDIKLLDLEPPKFSDVEVAQVRGPFPKKATVRGKEVSYIEWQVMITPEKDGTIIIPPAKALYKKVEQRQFRGGFADLFDMGFERKEMYSNPLKLTVEPLPPYSEPIQGVGHIEQFSRP